MLIRSSMVEVPLRPVGGIERGLQKAIDVAKVTGVGLTLAHLID